MVRKKRLLLWDGEWGVMFAVSFFLGVSFLHLHLLYGGASGVNAKPGICYVR